MLIKILKWVGIIVGSLVLVLTITYTVIAININHRVNKIYTFKREVIQIPTDSATLKRGAHLIAIQGCNECHGSNLSGKVLVNDAIMGTLASSNLTKGEGGLPKNFDDADWLLALRHGVGKDGKPLLYMPSHETAKLTRQDLAAIVAYCKALRPVKNVLPAPHLGPVVTVLSYFGKMPLFPVEKINHEVEISDADTRSGVALGKYLTVSCTGCHRENLKGGEAIVPGGPTVPNLTSSGDPGKWTLAQFMATLRTGKTPAGHQMKPEDMPWKMTAQYTDEEIGSIYAYLKSIK